MERNHQTEIDYSVYDSMSDQELENILRDDVNRDDSDVNAVLYAMELLAVRKRKKGEIPFSAESSLESFKKNYMDDYEDEKVIHISKRTWIRPVAATAAVICIFLCSVLTAQALGFPIMNYIVRWASETFSLTTDERQDVPPPETSDTQELLCEEGYLEVHGIPTTYYPRWLPEGFMLEDVQITETPFETNILFVYKRNEENILFSINMLQDDSAEHMEQSADRPTVYYVGDIPVYISSNIDTNQAVWRIDCYEYYIAGSFSFEETIKIIDNMKEVKP